MNSHNYCPEVTRMTMVDYCPNVRLWLYEGLGELNVLRMLYQRSTLVI